MKYAFMTFSTPTLSLEEALDVATKYGYDAIEPRMDAKHEHGIEVDATAEQRAAARDLARSKGVEMACLATSLRFANPADEEQMVADAHARIDLAGDCGIPCMRVFGGAFPDEISREDASAQLVKCFGMIADHAGERGVTICFETHDSWCDPNHVAAVLKAANHPNIQANWDIMHPIRRGGATMDGAFEALKPFVRHMHIHDGIMENPAQGESMMRPIGEGVVDHKRALELMMTTEYDGVMSGEWINWSPYDEHLPREIAILKKIEVELA